MPVAKYVYIFQFEFNAKTFLLGKIDWKDEHLDFALFRKRDIFGGELCTVLPVQNDGGIRLTLCSQPMLCANGLYIV